MNREDDASKAVQNGVTHDASEGEIETNEAVVIPFPAAEFRQGGRPGVSSSPRSHFIAPSPDRVTLQALEEAVRSAIAAQSDLGQRTRPGAADELITQVVSALAGRDVSKALSETIARIPPEERAAKFSVSNDNAGESATPLSEPDTDPVEAPHAPFVELAALVREGVTQFLQSFAERARETREQAFDLSAIRQQGPVLLGNLIQGFASALLQSARRPEGTPPSTDEEGREEGPALFGHFLKSFGATISEASRKPQGTPPSEETPRDVEPHAKLDLGDFLAALFRRPPSR